MVKIHPQSQAPCSAKALGQSFGFAESTFVEAEWETGYDFLTLCLAASPHQAGEAVELLL